MIRNSLRDIRNTVFDQRQDQRSLPNSTTKLSLICFRLEDWNWRVREVRDGPGT